MGRRPKTRPSFFKTLILPDFHTILRLPPHFWQRYGSDLPEEVKLRVCSGRTWGVEVGVLEGGLFGFKSGWEEFAEQVGLEFGEFVVFSFDGNSIFDVSIYGNTACQREIHLHHHTNQDGIKKSGGSKVEKKECLEEMSPLYFEILLKSHHKSRVSLLRRFIEAADLKGKPSVGVRVCGKPPLPKCEARSQGQRPGRPGSWLARLQGC